MSGIYIPGHLEKSKSSRFPKSTLNLNEGCEQSPPPSIERRLCRLRRLRRSSTTKNKYRQKIFKLLN